MMPTVEGNRCYVIFSVKAGIVMRETYYLTAHYMASREKKKRSVPIGGWVRTQITYWLPV